MKLLVLLKNAISWVFDNKIADAEVVMYDSWAPDNWEPDDKAD